MAPEKDEKNSDKLLDATKGVDPELIDQWNMLIHGGQIGPNEPAPQGSSGAREGSNSSGSSSTSNSNSSGFTPSQASLDPGIGVAAFRRSFFSSPPASSRSLQGTATQGNGTRRPGTATVANSHSNIGEYLLTPHLTGNEIMTAAQFETNLARQNLDPMTADIMRYGFYTTAHWMIIAEGETGVEEFPGEYDNLRIVDYLIASGLGEKYWHDATAWCAAFVSWVLREGDVTTFKSSLARDWGRYGKSISKPAVGAIAVFSRGTMGHGGFVAGISSDGNTLLILGGNQSDRVQFALKPLTNLLGYRFPKGFIPNYNLPILNVKQIKFINSNGKEN